MKFNTFGRFWLAITLLLGLSAGTPSFSMRRSYRPEIITLEEVQKLPQEILYHANQYLLETLKEDNATIVLKRKKLINELTRIARKNKIDTNRSEIKEIVKFVTKLDQEEKIELIQYLVGLSMTKKARNVAPRSKFTVRARPKTSIKKRRRSTVWSCPKASTKTLGKKIVPRSRSAVRSRPKTPSQKPVRRSRSVVRSRPKTSSKKPKKLFNPTLNQRSRSKSTVRARPKTPRKTSVTRNNRFNRPSCHKITRSKTARENFKYKEVPSKTKINPIELLSRLKVEKLPGSKNSIRLSIPEPVKIEENRLAFIKNKIIKNPLSIIESNMAFGERLEQDLAKQIQHLSEEKMWELMVNLFSKATYPEICMLIECHDSCCKLSRKKKCNDPRTNFEQDFSDKMFFKTNKNQDIITGHFASGAAFPTLRIETLFTKNEKDSSFSLNNKKQNSDIHMIDLSYKNVLEALNKSANKGTNLFESVLELDINNIDIIDNTYRNEPLEEYLTRLSEYLDKESALIRLYQFAQLINFLSQISHRNISLVIHENVDSLRDTYFWNLKRPKLDFATAIDYTYKGNNNTNAEFAVINLSSFCMKDIGILGKLCISDYGNLTNEIEKK